MNIQNVNKPMNRAMTEPPTSEAEENPHPPTPEDLVPPEEEEAVAEPGMMMNVGAEALLTKCTV